MARKIFQRFAPSQQRLRQMRSLSVLGDWIYEPNLWHINRHSTATAFAIGLFCAMVPAPGQVFVAAFAAVRLRANLPLSISLIFVTNPLTMPVIYYAAYELGAFLLDTPLQDIEFEITWSWLSQRLGDIWQPFLLGCFVIGVIAGLMGYIVINLLWRWRVSRAWQQRSLLRQRRQP
ncbi:MAG: DUF2062 domain-containing protein [Luminiphilus sp.]|jgi:uncharacterized protein (DUF2062 family)